MSDYGVFEASSTDGHEEEQRQRQATRDLGRAIEAAREGFGDFLSGASDKQDYSDRLALVMNDLMQKVADSGVMPVPGVMRKVKAALRPEFRQAANGEALEWAENHFQKRGGDKSDDPAQLWKDSLGLAGDEFGTNFSAEDYARHSSRKKAYNDGDAAEAAAAWAESLGYNDPWGFASWLVGKGYLYPMSDSEYQQYLQEFQAEDDPGVYGSSKQAASSWKEVNPRSEGIHPDNAVWKIQGPNGLSGTVIDEFKSGTDSDWFIFGPNGPVLNRKYGEPPLTVDEAKKLVEDHINSGTLASRKQAGKCQNCDGMGRETYETDTGSLSTQTCKTCGGTGKSKQASRKQANDIPWFSNRDGSDEVIFSNGSYMLINPDGSWQVGDGTFMTTGQESSVERAKEVAIEQLFFFGSKSAKRKQANDSLTVDAIVEFLIFCDKERVSSEDHDSLDLYNGDDEISQDDYDSIYDFIAGDLDEDLYRKVNDRYRQRAGSRRKQAEKNEHFSSRIASVDFNWESETDPDGSGEVMHIAEFDNGVSAEIHELTGEVYWSVYSDETVVQKGTASDFQEAEALVASCFDQWGSLKDWAADDRWASKKEAQEGSRRKQAEVDTEDMGVLNFFYQFENEGLEPSAPGDEQWEWLKNNVDYDVLQDKIDQAYEYGELGRGDADSMAYDLQQTFFGSRKTASDAQYEGWVADIEYGEDDEGSYEMAHTTTPSGDEADSIYPMNGRSFDGGELNEALKELAAEYGDDAYSGTYQYNSSRKQAFSEQLGVHLTEVFESGEAGGGWSPITGERLDWAKGDLEFYGGSGFFRDWSLEEDGDDPDVFGFSTSDDADIIDAAWEAVDYANGNRSASRKTALELGEWEEDIPGLGYAKATKTPGGGWEVYIWDEAGQNETLTPVNSSEEARRLFQDTIKGYSGSGYDHIDF